MVKEHRQLFKTKDLKNKQKTHYRPSIDFILKAKPKRILPPKMAIKWSKQESVNEILYKQEQEGSGSVIAI